MNIDSTRTPFSRYGSYFAYGTVPAKGDRLQKSYVKTVNGDVTSRNLFQVELLDHEGLSLPFNEIVTPTILRLESTGGAVELCIPEPTIVRICTQGVTLRLRKEHINMFETVLAFSPKRWLVDSLDQRRQYLLTALQGSLIVNAPWHVEHVEHAIIDLVPDPQTGAAELVLEEFRSSSGQADHTESFAACLERVEAEYQTWLTTMPSVPPELTAAAELAAYINWSCVVAPEGRLKRPSMYMSKNWMTNVWSWDHCFNAMALVYHNPALAWDQLMTLFDQQDAYGALPDLVNNNGIIWNFCKPPIHGWTLRWMMQRADFIDEAHLREIYEPLTRWTNWWFTQRDDDRDGLPEYHHGNDSGWDNSSVFLRSPLVEGPDLLAYLILQMETLAEVARRLGKQDEAQTWEERANASLDTLFARLWNGEHFIALQGFDHTPSESESLLLYLPIVLGKRLPEEVRVKLIADLKEEGRFLTEHGLATESVRSPFYISDGYWLGPIWAPSTLIIVDGLRACGETELARSISRKFCAMAARSGMAENFDALTGEGLRDRAYSWTSSVFLVLAHEYV